MQHTTSEASLVQSAMAWQFSPAEVAAKAGAIYRQVLAESTALDAGNFSAISPADLARMFELYDAGFFEGALRSAVDREAGGRLKFRFSRRMTSVGGTTTRFRHRSPPGQPPKTSYEIAVSSTLLFQSFADLERSVLVNGIECRDRLEALQRIFEHELLHLLEMLAWGHSSCAGSNYRLLARRVFAHPEVKHQLVTQRERALTRHQIRVGERVSFDYEGEHLSGVVNRITRRATVLVERADGAPYTDGKRYAKYYIPLLMLRKASD